MDDRQSQGLDKLLLVNLKWVHFLDKPSRQAEDYWAGGYP
jgi:hypothetical protein